tara:strand:+ start:240 stop:536 length:297 start_codon:yes stop_codon:yes gene_type:complete
MNRKQRRALEKQVGGKTSQNFSDKISQFNKLPEQCSTCEEEFDRTDRDMLKSWNVVVRQEIVRLFCPDCMDKAKQAIKQYGEKDGSPKTIVPCLEEGT